LGERLTGSQKVGGSNPPGSTIKPNHAIENSGNPNAYHSISPNRGPGLAVPLYRLIEGFLLSCRVENKSPATVSFNKNILDKFQWFLNKFGIETDFSNNNSAACSGTQIREWVVLGAK
jgi:hypothetical protein